MRCIKPQNKIISTVNKSQLAEPRCTGNGNAAGLEIAKAKAKAMATEYGIWNCCKRLSYGNSQK